VFPYVSNLQVEPKVTVHVWYKCYKRLILILWPHLTCDTYVVQPSVPYAMSLHCLLVVTLILRWGSFVVCGVGAQWLLTDCTCNSFASSLHRGPRTISASPSISSSQSKLRYSNRCIHHATRSNLQCCPSICVGRREATNRWPVFWPRFEPATLRIRSRSATHSAATCGRTVLYKSDSKNVCQRFRTA